MTSHLQTTLLLTLTIAMPFVLPMDWMSYRATHTSGVNCQILAKGNK